MIDSFLKKRKEESEKYLKEYGEYLELLTKYGVEFAEVANFPKEQLMPPIMTAFVTILINKEMLHRPTLNSIEKAKKILQDTCKIITDFQLALGDTDVNKYDEAHQIAISIDLLKAISKQTMSNISDLNPEEREQATRTLEAYLFPIFMKMNSEDNLVRCVADALNPKKVKKVRGGANDLILTGDPSAFMDVGNMSYPVLDAQNMSFPLATTENWGIPIQALNDTSLASYVVEPQNNITQANISTQPLVPNASLEQYVINPGSTVIDSGDTSYPVKVTNTMTIPLNPHRPSQEAPPPPKTKEPQKEVQIEEQKPPSTEEELENIHKEMEQTQADLMQLQNEYEEIEGEMTVNKNTYAIMDNIGKSLDTSWVVNTTRAALNLKDGEIATYNEMSRMLKIRKLEEKAKTGLIAAAMMISGEEALTPIPPIIYEGWKTVSFLFGDALLYYWRTRYTRSIDPAYFGEYRTESDFSYGELNEFWKKQENDIAAATKVCNRELGDEMCNAILEIVHKRELGNKARCEFIFQAQDWLRQTFNEEFNKLPQKLQNEWINSWAKYVNNDRRKNPTGLIFQINHLKNYVDSLKNSQARMIASQENKIKYIYERVAAQNESLRQLTEAGKLLEKRAVEQRANQILVEQMMQREAQNTNQTKNALVQTNFTALSPQTRQTLWQVCQLHREGFNKTISKVIKNNMNVTLTKEDEKKIGEACESFEAALETTQQINEQIEKENENINKINQTQYEEASAKAFNATKKQAEEQQDISIADNTTEGIDLSFFRTVWEWIGGLSAVKIFDDVCDNFKINSIWDVASLLVGAFGIISQTTGWPNFPGRKFLFDVFLFPALGNSMGRFATGVLSYLYGKTIGRTAGALYGAYMSLPVLGRTFLGYGMSLLIKWGVPFVWNPVWGWIKTKLGISEKTAEKIESAAKDALAIAKDQYEQARSYVQDFAELGTVGIQAAAQQAMTAMPRTRPLLQPLTKPIPRPNVPTNTSFKLSPFVSHVKTEKVGEIKLPELPKEPKESKKPKEIKHDSVTQVNPTPKGTRRLKTQVKKSTKEKKTKQKKKEEKQKTAQKYLKKQQPKKPQTKQKTEKTKPKPKPKLSPAPKPKTTKPKATKRASPNKTNTSSNKRRKTK